jgi:hypothetical protein
MYVPNVNPGATAATIDHAIVGLWNPSTTRTALLKDLSCVFQAAAPAAGAGFVTRRCTARGTPASTITPTAEHHHRREAAPDSGFLVDLGAYSVQPTLAAGELDPQWAFSAVQASGLMRLVAAGVGLEIPPGTGLVFVNMAAVIFAASQWGFSVDEV